MARSRCRAAAIGLASLLAIAVPACGEAGTGSGAATGAPQYDTAGPSAVGVTTLGAAGGDDTTIVIWYPAQGPASSEPSPDVPGNLDEGPYPLVLFAHGVRVEPADYEPLLAHVASWGFVVAAPEQVKGADLVEDSEHIRSSTAADDGPLQGLLEPAGPIVVGGHSAGTGYAAVAASGDRADQVLGSFLMAGGGARQGATESPTLFLAGGRDRIASSWVRAGFDAARTPKELVIIDDGGHLTFTDLCARSDGSVALQPSDRAAPGIPDKSLSPIINHATVAFLRWRFGLDGSPSALAPEAISALTEQAVTIEGSFDDRG